MRTIKTPEVGTQALNVIEDILRKLVTELYNLTDKVQSFKQDFEKQWKQSPTMEQRIAGVRENIEFDRFDEKYSARSEFKNDKKEEKKTAKEKKEAVQTSLPSC